MTNVGRITHWRILFGVAALLGYGPAATAQKQTPQPVGEASTGSLERLLASRPLLNQLITIDDAVTVALRESPVVRGASEEVQAAIGRMNAARAERRPWVSANTFASGGSNGNLVAGPISAQPQMIMALPRDAFFDQNVMVMFPLYTGGCLCGGVGDLQDE